MTLLSLVFLIFILFLGYIVGAAGIVLLIVLAKKRHTKSIKPWVFVVISSITVLAIGLNSFYFTSLRRTSDKKLLEIREQQKLVSKHALESLDFPVYSVSDTSRFKTFNVYPNEELLYLKLYFVLDSANSRQTAKRTITMYEYSRARVNLEVRSKLVNFEGSCVTGQNACTKVADTAFGTVYSLDKYEKRKSSDKKYDYYMVEKSETSIFFESVNIAEEELVTFIDDLIEYDALSIPGF